MGRKTSNEELLVERGPDAVFLADAATGEITDVNQRAVELTGYTESELRAMDVFELHPGGQRERYVRLFDERSERAPRDRFDDGTPLYIRRADGTDVPIEMSTSTVALDDRTLVQGFVRDISDRRERERELERHREFLQQTQEFVSVGGWELTLDPERLRWTDEVYRIHDLPLDTDLTAAMALEFYHPDDSDRIEAAFDRLVSEGEPYDLKLRIVTAEDRVRWVRTLGRPRDDDDGDELAAVHGVIQDITEQRERERDLEVKNRALDESTVGITIADADQPDLPIVYANEGFQRVTGYPRDRILDNNCRFLQGERTDETTISNIRAAIDAEEPIRTEILNYRADGTPFWNKLTVAPVGESEGGDVTHYVGIQEDITARKRQKRLISVFQRVLRHNLRNDMTVIGGFAAEIAERTDGETATMARRIEDTAAGLTELSEKAYELEVSISDTESVRLRNAVEDIRSVAADLRREYPDLSVSVNGPESVEVLSTSRLKLALRELGENAAKHSNAQSVRFRIELTDDGTVAIHVDDDGPGLPDSERRVLEDAGETPLEHGRGLGLWLVNWIVTGLGGNVSATVDDGTTVTIRFSKEGDRRPRPTTHPDATGDTRE